MAERKDKEEPPVPRRQRSALTALILLALFAVIAAAKIAAAFLIPVVVGMLASYSLKPLVVALERVHIHRAIGAAVVLLLLSGALAGGVLLLRDDATAALSELPNAARKIRLAAQQSARQPEGPVGHVRAAAEELNRAAVEATSGGKPATAPPPAPTPTVLQQWMSEQSAKALEVIVEIGIAGLLAYFLLAAGDTFRRKLVHAAGPTLAARRITVEILDEIDAPLDEENIGRFTAVLCELAQGAQFMVITHNKRTMGIADSLFGVTMEEPGISKLVSVRLSDLQPA